MNSSPFRDRQALATSNLASGLGGGLLALILPTVAAAQSVTLYGAVDGSLVVSRNGAAGVPSDKRVASGIALPSRWGFRGTEDLGSGLKAVFVLEAGLELNTGAAKSYSGNPATATATAPNGTPGIGFNRRSFVGLEGRFGAVNLGRDYTPVYWTIVKTDPMGLTLFGNVQAITLPAGGVERWGRISNAVFYTSPNLGGFTGRAAYSFGSSGGGAAGLPRRANTFTALGGDFVSGGLTVSTSYQELTYPVVGGTPAAFTGAVAKRKDAAVGAAYAFSDYSVSGGYWKVGHPQNASDVWAGGSIVFGPTKLMATIQRLRQDNPTGGAERAATSVGIGALYSLSKRTALYATYGRVSNNDVASFALFSADNAVTAGAVGASPSAFALGVRHVF